MRMNDYQLAAWRTAPEGVSLEHDLMHGAMGLCTESGELLDVVKKHYAYGRQIDWVNIKEEMGDQLFYLALLCRAAGCTLQEVAQANVDKLKSRYPDKFDANLAINRNIENERRVLTESLEERE